MLPDKTYNVEKTLWGKFKDLLGAAEYILHAGNKINFCERGITAPHTHSATSRYLMDLTLLSP